jgi:iron-regulated transporter 1
MSKASNALLVSRFLTRSGDRAWDFAVPLALIALFPGQLQVASMYFLMVKLLSLALTPYITELIDRRSSKWVFSLGIGLQFFFVIAECICFYFLLAYEGKHFMWQEHFGPFIGVILARTGSNLGAQLMEIAVGYDLALDVVGERHIHKFNTVLRRLDLLTEVISPLIAGLVMTSNSHSFSRTGLLCIALWNILSFFSEYFLLSFVLNQHTKIKALKAKVENSIFQIKFYQKFFSRPFALLSLSYVFLFISVLTPHGLLMTAYLKDAMQFSENKLAIFRSLGAVSGFLATYVFEKCHHYFGLAKSSLILITVQALCLLVGLIFFLQDTSLTFLYFLGFLILSRIGLYGFVLSEMEIRQKLVHSSERGEMNGKVQTLSQMALILVFFSGSFVTTPKDFNYLIYGSAFFVTVGALISYVWYKRLGKKLLS